MVCQPCGGVGDTVGGRAVTGRAAAGVSAQTSARLAFQGSGRSAEETRSGFPLVAGGTVEAAGREGETGVGGRLTRLGQWSFEIKGRC